LVEILYNNSGMTNVVMSDFFLILGYRSMHAYSISFYETVTGITEKQINNRCIYNHHPNRPPHTEILIQLPGAYTIMATTDPHIGKLKSNSHMDTTMTILQ
jgi:hypothetical protein